LRLGREIFYASFFGYMRRLIFYVSFNNNNPFSPPNKKPLIHPASEVLHSIIHLNQHYDIPAEHLPNLQLHQSFFRIELDRLLEVRHHSAQALSVPLL
jgi:hypothetical protein